MSRRLIIFGLVLVGLFGLGLFQVKLAVEEKDHHLDALYLSQFQDQKAIRVLEAEWAYLNSPDRLQDLAIRHLKLAPTLPTQIIEGLTVIPYRAGERTERDPDNIYPAPRNKPLSRSWSRSGQSDTASDDTMTAANGRVVSLPISSEDPS